MPSSNRRSPLARVLNRYDDEFGAPDIGRVPYERFVKVVEQKNAHAAEVERLRRPRFERVARGLYRSL
jgi:hypothetical protein